MASGVELGRGFKHYDVQLLDALTATSNGFWMSTGGYYHGSIRIKGITSATVKVVGSNDPTAPAATDHGQEIISVTSNALILFGELPKWIKVYISVYVSGTISAHGRLRS